MNLDSTIANAKEEFEQKLTQISAELWQIIIDLSQVVYDHAASERTIQDFIRQKREQFRSVHEHIEALGQNTSAHFQDILSQAAQYQQVVDQFNSLAQDLNGQRTRKKLKPKERRLAKKSALEIRPQDLTKYVRYLRKLNDGNVVTMPLSEGETQRIVMRYFNQAATQLGVSLQRLPTDSLSVRFKVSQPRA